MRKILQLLCMAFAAMACGVAQASAEAEVDAAVRAEVAAASRAFSDAYVRNDTATLASLYTEDALAIPPGREIRGREAIGKYFQWAPRYRQVAHSMTPSEMTVRHDLVVDVGQWTSTNQRGDGTPSTATGRYMVLWVREADGKWRMKYDMWHRPEGKP